jgi:quinol monooxygenase YgiN
MDKDAVYFVVSLNIHEGQLAAFQEIADAMIASTRKEPGALAYEWHFSSDHKRCRLLETYVDQKAVSAHMGGTAVQQFGPKLLQISSASSFEIYGDPGASAGMLTAMGAQIFERWKGISTG